MHGPLRIIFSLTVLIFWVLLGVGLATGQWTGTQWLMLALGHATCAVIVVMFVHVFTYGYSLAMVVIPLAVMALMPSPAAFLVGLIALAFGLRMTFFVYARNRSASYAESMARQRDSDARVPLPLRVFMWISVSWLVGFELMALYFVARDGRLTPLVLAGAAIMLLGLVLEAIADAQKQAAKARDAAAWASDGIYRLARHPNYAGEIVFQLGVIVAALGSVAGAWEFLVMVLGPAYLTTLMVFAARDADHVQLERYGKDAGYQDYRGRTGTFLPWL